LKYQTPFEEIGVKTLAGEHVDCDLRARDSNGEFVVDLHVPFLRVGIEPSKADTDLDDVGGVCLPC
jgi:hypothetical protein